MILTTIMLVASLLNITIMLQLTLMWTPLANLKRIPIGYRIWMAKLSTRHRNKEKENEQAVSSSNHIRSDAHQLLQTHHAQNYRPPSATRSNQKTNDSEANQSYLLEQLRLPTDSAVAISLPGKFRYYYYIPDDQLPLDEKNNRLLVSLTHGDRFVLEEQLRLASASSFINQKHFCSVDKSLDTLLLTALTGDLYDRMTENVTLYFLCDGPLSRCCEDDCCLIPRIQHRDLSSTAANSNNGSSMGSIFQRSRKSGKVIYINKQTDNLHIQFSGSTSLWSFRLHFIANSTFFGLLLLLNLSINS